MTDELTPEAAIPLIEEFWDLPAGYFFKLRQGEYDAGGAERFEALLRSIRTSDNAPLPRRFVALIWMVPSFMEWQIDRVSERGGDAESLQRDIVRVRNALNDVLGAP
jgi:hypothetical protein